MMSVSTRDRVAASIVTHNCSSRALLIVISVLCAASESVAPTVQKAICASQHTWSTSICCSCSSCSSALSSCDLGEAADVGETAHLGETTAEGDAADLGDATLGGVTAGLGDDAA